MNVAPQIRAALIGNTAIAAMLATWEGEPSVHTRRPLPSTADSYPLIAISPDVSFTDTDFLNGDLSTVIRDIAIYGKQPDDYREVEDLGYMVRKLFHRNKDALFNESYHVVSLVVSGPSVAPTDDANIVGRMVTLTIRIQEK